MTRSLRRTLLTWLLLPLLPVVVLLAVLQVEAVRRPTQLAFDHALGDAALAVAAFVREGADGAVSLDMTAGAERALRTDQVDNVYYAVIGPDGHRLGGDPQLEEPLLKVAADQWRWLDAHVDDADVRMVVRGLACGRGVCQVRVAETVHKREGVLREALMIALAGVTLFVSASVASMLLAARQGLRPIGTLGSQLHQRSLDDLRPLEPAQVPRELSPLVDALNRLFQRVREGSLGQQAFLADAAHQLRTPLTALKTECELALLQGHPRAVEDTLRRVDLAAGRAARMSTQLLALARSDQAAQAALPMEPLDLRDLAGEAADEWVPRALAVGVDLGFELQPALATGRRFLLRELLSNLLHNALAYAGQGHRVTVRTGHVPGAVQLEVEDDGPGIPPAERLLVFERFRRGAAATGAGSGLGLAIVRDIAAGHGGRVQILDAAGAQGTLVRVTLPGRSHA